MPFSIPEGSQKARYVQDRFSVIAARYDLFNDLITQGMHRYWKNFLVREARIGPGNKALDICCGTGDIAQRLRQKVGRNGQVIGLDFAEDMLRVAGSRNPGQTVDLVQGDAMMLPVKDESVDAVTVGFGLRNLVRIEPCLQDVLRVLKPGGRFLSLDMGKVKLPVIRKLFHFYFFSIVPRIGKIIYPKESFFDYFPHSSLKYPSQERLAEMMQDVGFRNIRFVNFHFGSTVVHIAQKPL